MKFERWAIPLTSLALLGMQSPAHKTLTPMELALNGKIVPALRAAQKTPTGVADTLRSLLDTADTQISERQIKEAQATLKAASEFLAAYAKVKNHKPIPHEPLKGRQLRVEGIRLGDDREFEKAEKTLKEALALSKQGQDLALEAGVHNNLSFVYRATDRFEEAAQESLTARDIAQSQKDTPRAGSYNFNLGLALFQLKRWDPAHAAFKLAAEQNKAASKTRLEATSIFWQARALHRLNPTATAPLKHLDEARRLYEKLEDRRNVARCYWEMADQTAYRMDFGTAAIYAEQAIPLYAAANDREGLRISYMLLVEVYGKLNQAELVEKYKKKLGELPPSN